MKAFVRNILQAICNYPDEVVITELAGRHIVILEIRCHKDDMGRIIGKSGKTISAIRTLLSTLGAKQKCKVTLEVVE
jgi:predicted RNA-binding protein YlqC (UPF0109 family)